MAFILSLLACQETDFKEAYLNPAKLANTTVEKQYTGFLVANKDYVIPNYNHYFTALRITLNRYNQACGWANDLGQYVPGSSGVENVWLNYYSTLAHFRELENIYNALPKADQENRKIYILTAKVYLYDHTQRMVDLFGAIPFTEAGKLSVNNGNYDRSLPKFDTPEILYILMLDELKNIANELGKINLSDSFKSTFTIHDYINYGDINAWKIYCNSLRLRMLNRVSATSSFSSRATTEMVAILNNPGDYPVVENNKQNILIDIKDVNSDLNSKGIEQAFDGALSWYLQTAGKTMMDYMTANEDPRLLTLFEPGKGASGKYIGISTIHPAVPPDSLIATYNKTTFTFNRSFPGVLPNAAEIDLIKAEYYLRNADEAKAQMAYEKAIGESIDFYYYIQSLSDDRRSAAKAAPSEADKKTYINAKDVSWENNTDKLKLIAMQKWVHYNLVQPYENWADNRRLDKLGLVFLEDKTNKQTLPPVRWNIPSYEIAYNTKNYQTIKADDDLNKRLFWDVK